MKRTIDSLCRTYKAVLRPLKFELWIRDNWNNNIVVILSLKTLPLTFLGMEETESRGSETWRNERNIWTNILWRSTHDDLFNQIHLPLKSDWSTMKQNTETSKVETQIIGLCGLVEYEKRVDFYSRTEQGRTGTVLAHERSNDLFWRTAFHKFHRHIPSVSRG